MSSMHGCFIRKLLETLEWRMKTTFIKIPARRVKRGWKVQKFQFKKKQNSVMCFYINTLIKKKNHCIMVDF